MISVTSKGSFRNTEAFLHTMQKLDITQLCHAAGRAGVEALSSATPYETGLAAHSWGYNVVQNAHGFTINWTNGDVENGFPVILALQFGHGTGTGGYVQGRDFINPAIRPIFDQLSAQLWKAVTSA